MELTMVDQATGETMIISELVVMEEGWWNKLVRWSDRPLIYVIYGSMVVWALYYLIASSLEH